MHPGMTNATVTDLTLTSIDGVPLDATIHEPQCLPSLGAVVLAHGITVDKAEGGMFVRLAERLAAAGYLVLRFSFRGHGRSGGTQRGVTIAGELLDLDAALAYLQTRSPRTVSIVAASFGAVSAALSLEYLGDRLSSLVLWNPVLDLRRTFLEPELPWGRENFGPEQLSGLRERGYLRVDGEFALGRVLFEEFAHYDPAIAFGASKVPALVIHGDKDSYVSYEVAQEAAASRTACLFHTVSGSDHGFDSREREDEAIQVTVDWLGRQPGAPV